MVTSSGTSHGRCNRLFGQDTRPFHGHSSQRTRVAGDKGRLGGWACGVVGRRVICLAEKSWDYSGSDWGCRWRCGEGTDAEIQSSWEDEDGNLIYYIDLLSGEEWNARWLRKLYRARTVERLTNTADNTHSPALPFLRVRSLNVFLDEKCRWCVRKHDRGLTMNCHF